MKKYLKDTFTEIKEIIEFERIVNHDYSIIPKEFTIIKLSDIGREIFHFKPNEQGSFSGKFYHDSGPSRRVVFNPHPIYLNDSLYFIELKGYGMNGKDISLIYHDDGDVLFGMFYKNAKKEYNILERASDSRLSVPFSILLGKFDKNIIIDSGLRNYAELLNPPMSKASEVEKIYNQLKEIYQSGVRDLEDYLKTTLFGPISEDPIAILKQPYNLGILVRAAKSPFRLGDPSKNYTISEEIVTIARSTGDTFIELINLGFLHLCPSTGNWTVAGELTDMSDCYDLKKDRNLGSLILKRENETRKDFWEDLIGQRITGNLSCYFIEGMFKEKLSIKEAAQEVKIRVSRKMSELTK